MLLTNPKVPSPTIVEVTFEVVANRVVSTVLRKPRVPNPMSVELRTGCIELILLKNPIEPRPSTVEFRLDVRIYPPALRLDTNPREPRPCIVEFNLTDNAELEIYEAVPKPATVERRKVD